MAQDETHKNYDLFRDCLSTILIERLTKPEPKPRRRARSRAGNKQSKETDTASEETHEDTCSSDVEELAEFVDYIAAQTFESLPEELKDLDHYAYAEDAELQARYALPLTADDVAALLPTLDVSVSESLATYGIIDATEQRENGGGGGDSSSSSIYEFLAAVLTAMLTVVATPPPPPSSTRGKITACELCGRDWIDLTYHHLIPRFVHAKAVKRGWHRPEDLQNVAWLCGACHRFVHRFAGHEDLARYYYTVDLLLAQDEVVRFARWVARLRWKGR
ncbi:hypothetical protein BX600DRAFT_519264 [Xylariales sp. PMI_506]|nr:hypothetical protein BX600DRAFT_519264 [Xylariales sp. PMI_506]